MAESARLARYAADRVRLLVLLALLASGMVAGCGEAGTSAAAESIGIDGVSLELPPGWDGYARRERGSALIRAASAPLAQHSAFPPALADDGIAVDIRAQAPQADSASFARLSPPLTLADGFLLDIGRQQIIQARMGDRALLVRVFFGRPQPTEAMRVWANELLASLTVAGSLVQEQREDGFVQFDDSEVGVSGRYPGAWHRAQAISKLVYPREVLALATYPLRDRAKAGECAPDTARADLSAGGAFVWLLEYRPARGEVWADLSRDRFPPKPERFELDRDELGGEHSCFPGPTYRTTLRAAVRPLQLLAAFGGPPSDERLNEVNEILTSLRFEELPAPPPDPYAGWPMINDNPGDSFRPPPGWAATAAMFPPAKTPRPRPLFFASNRPLPGLPAELVEHVDELRGPFPATALGAFPRDGVLVWALEEEKGEAAAAFRAIGHGWPAREDFEPAEAPARAPGVRWLRAGGSWMGYRFSIWIATGGEASKDDLALALKSAQTLAVSGCWRDGFEDCPDE